MNESNLSGILYHEANINNSNAVMLETLNKYGFVLTLGEIGDNTVEQISICIIDKIKKSNRPNILLICPGNLINRWYQKLISCGIDFKIASDSFIYLSCADDISNLYILPFDIIEGSKPFCVNPGEEKNNSFVWDLIVVDERQNVSGIKYDKYIENIGNKTDGMIFAFTKSADSDDENNLREVYLKLSNNDKDRDSVAAKIILDDNSCGFSLDSPVMRYFNERVYKGESVRKVNVVKYTIDDEALSGGIQRIELKTGLPPYRFGGNVFEEYNVPLDDVYNRISYSAEDLVQLRKFDAKMDAFLNMIDDIIKNSDDKIVVYCTTSGTINYLKKCLSAFYKNDNNIFNEYKTNLLENDSLMRKYGLREPENPKRILITTDKISAIGHDMNVFKHIINYELPTEPERLELRMLRHNFSDSPDISFTIFADENNLFDSRILKKVLAGKLYKCVQNCVPGKNILFNYDEIPEVITDIIFDLKDIAKNAAAHMSAELENEYKFNYETTGDEIFAGSDHMVKFVNNHLESILNSFSYGDFIIKKTNKKSDVLNKIRQIIDIYKTGVVYTNRDGKPNCINPPELTGYFYNDAYENYLKNNISMKISEELQKAEQEIDELYNNNNFYYNLNARCKKINGNILFAVIYNTWCYLKKSKSLSVNFREFMKLYNEGVI